jgi:hypothetical protein
MKRYWISILILAAGIVFLVVIAGQSLLPLLDIPSFIITVVTPFLFVSILFGFKETCRAFSTIRKNEKDHDVLMNALAFFKLYGKTTWFSAIIAAFAGGIGMLANLEDPACIGPNMALALVVLFYCGVIQLIIVIPYTVLIHKQLGNNRIRGDIFSLFGSLFGVCLVLLLNFIVILPVWEYHPSQQSEQMSNQVNPIEHFNGIKDNADVEGYGILEYELYDVPDSESSDFQAFIRRYTQMLDEYEFDKSSSYWIEDNTALSNNVKILMSKHKRNFSTTRLSNSDGSMTFIFNYFNSHGKYELYSIEAYKMKEYR